MMTAKDWVSFFIGAVIAILGLLPFITKSSLEGNIVSFLPNSVLPWILALGGIYLIVNAFIEITNSNIMGWISLFVGAFLAGFGWVPFLNGVLIGSPALMQIFLIINGIFLMIAAFAMEL